MMLSRKKLVFIGLAGFVLTACGNSGQSSDPDKVSLTISYYDGAISDTVIEKAKEEFSEWDLQFSEVPADDTFDTKLKTSLNSSSAPDITAINSNIQDFLPYYDKFLNLADYGSQDLSDQYVTWKWESTLADNGNYQMAMPIDIGPTALQYNVKNFEDAGLPTDPDEISETIVTLEDYMKAAYQMKEKADMPMFQSITELFNELARAMDQPIFTVDGELTFADGELREIWDFCIEAEQNNLILNVQANSGEGVNATQQGAFGAGIKASWGIADLEDSGVEPLQWLFAKAPGKPSNYGGSYLAGIATTKFPAETAELIFFLTNEDAQKINYEERALFPSVTSLYTEEFLNTRHELFGDYDFNKYFVQSAEELEYTPLHPNESTAISYFSDQLTLVAQQDKDPEQAWNDAVKETEILAEQ